MKKTSVFCFPYAGCIADQTYGKWQQALGDAYRVVPLEAAGHGRRISESFHPSIEATADDMFKLIESVARAGEDYIFYAHSMGTSIAYEAIKKVARHNLKTPMGMFVSGRLPPHHRYDRKTFHLLSDEELISELKKVEGGNHAALDNPDLCEIFLPIIRNDYKLLETYKFEHPPLAFDGFIDCLMCDNDSLVNYQDMQTWQHYCAGDFSIKRVSGHHFFVHDQYEMICQHIRTKLEGNEDYAMAETDLSGF